MTGPDTTMSSTAEGAEDAATAVVESPERDLASDQALETEASPLREPSYVVGVGASAGGLEALEELFEKMPLESGMAFVVVQHLSPDFKSLMDELLGRKTYIPVKIAEDAMSIEADTIYLLPPNQEMIAANNRL